MKGKTVLGLIAFSLAAPTALAQTINCNWTVDTTHAVSIWLTPQAGNLFSVVGKVSNTAPSQAVCTFGVCYSTTQDDLFTGIVDGTPRYNTQTNSPYFYGYLQFDGHPATLIVNAGDQSSGTIDQTGVTNGTVALATFNGCTSGG